MDGWMERKWGKICKALFYVNERCGCYFGDHLIADHPEIKSFLTTRTRVRRSQSCINQPCTMKIPIAQIESLDWHQNPTWLWSLVWYPKIRSWNRPCILQTEAKYKATRSWTLDSNPYAKQIKDAASDEVVFPGPIYQPQVGSLRYTHLVIFTDTLLAEPTLPFSSDAFAQSSNCTQQ